MADQHRGSEEEVTVFEISNILGNDVKVTQDWELLAYELKIPPTTITHNITPVFSANRSPILGFVTLLTLWISMTKRMAATVKNLCRVLKERNFNLAADKISKKYAEGMNIVAMSSNGMNEMEGDFGNLNISSHPHGIKILEIPPSNEKKLVIYTTRIIELLELASDKHVVIISINGRQRMGKSFMLNQFQKYLQFGYNNSAVEWINKRLEHPFEWGGSIDRITSGIEVLSKPSFLNANGEEIAVYLMDTQGLFDNQTDTRDNILIFAFSLLLSSVTIFNDKVYSEDVLQFLQIFLEYAKITAADNGGNNQKFSFQRLTFLLRDWAYEQQFKLGYYDDNECPPGQILNLKHKFLGTDNSNLSEEAKKIRKAIVSSFKDINFFASPHPYRTSALDADNPSQWDEDFRNCVKEFVMRTLSQESLAKAVKSIGNVKQTGRSLSAYVGAWAEIILSAEGLPEFSTLLDATIKLHYEGINANVIATYQLDMEIFILQNPKGASPTNFSSMNERIVAKCLRLFQDCSKVGGEDAKTRYAVKLQSTLERVKENFQKINDSNLKAEQQRKRRLIAEALLLSSLNCTLLPYL